MTHGLCNIIHGQRCPPVVCQKRGAFFEWWNGYRWCRGDVLPHAINRLLPTEEQERCRRHRETRILEQA